MKYTFLILIATMMTFSGCQFGGEALPKDMPKLVPAKIQVTQDGAPLAGAAVLLIDSAGNRQWEAGGMSDASGTIELYTNGRYKGAPAGKYKVVVTKTETDPSQAGPDPGIDDPKYGEYMAKLASERLATYTLVDRKFADEKNTPLEVEIKKGGEVHKFDVGEKVKIKISG